MQELFKFCILKQKRLLDVLYNSESEREIWNLFSNAVTVKLLIEKFVTLIAKRIWLHILIAFQS